MALPSLFRSSRDRALAPREPMWALRREMDRLFEDFWRDFDFAPPALRGDAFGRFTPRVDLEETEGEVLLTAELPGLEDKDFELTLEGDVLTIRGEKREEHGDRSQGWYERSYGSFSRSVPLPCEVEADKASAEYKKGLLRVRLPKAATAKERSRTIPVKAAS